MRPLAALRAFALVALAPLSGCDGCQKKDQGPPPVVAALPPVPAPEGLLAEAVLATPDATWQRVQRGVGGTAGILPSTLGGMVAAASGLDPTLGLEVDGAQPAYVVVGGDPAAPGWAIAARLADPRRARASLAAGDTARFDVKPVGGLDALVPKRPGSAGPLAALSPGGYLVVASGEGELLSLGPYATRTMPSRPAPKEQIALDVPGGALAGAVRAAAAKQWADFQRRLLAQDDATRTQHGGRAPDFGDPRAIVSSMDAWVQGKLDVLGGWKAVHVAFDAGDTDVRAVVTAIPASTDGPASKALASLRTGDVEPMRALPRETALAVLTRDDASLRAADAEGLGRAIGGALGPRLGAADTKKLQGALDDWAGGRGDWQLVAAPFGPALRGLLVEAPVADAQRARRAVEQGADVAARSAAVREPLAAWLGVKQVTSGSAPLAGGGRADMVTFAAPPAGKGAAPVPPIGLAWAALPDGPRPAEIRVALSDAPLPLLSPPPPGGALGDDPTIRGMLDPLGAVAGALVVQPSRAPGCSGATGAVVVAWSRRPAEEGQPESMWGELIASDAALRCLAPRPF